jgi:peptide/nickel transport system substrate-binding protein
MNGFKVALLSVIAVLLLIVFVDQVRRPEQLGEMSKSFREMAEASRAQTDELRRLRTAIESRPLVPVPTATPSAVLPPTTSSETPTITSTEAKPAENKRSDLKPAVITAAPAGPVLDGVPRLNVEFLKPLDRSYLNPAHMGGTLRMFASTPKGLNPLLSNDAFTSDIQDSCNDALATHTAAEPETWFSQLAESAIISDDFKTYTFTLRKGVRWQTPLIAERPEFAWLRQPQELTSADFAFAIQLVLDPKVDCEHLRSYYQDLERVETPDPYTLRLVWKKKVFTSLSSSLGASPLPKHIYGRNGDGSLIPDDQVAVVFNKHWFDEQRGVCGVGEFRLVEFTADKVARLRRNPDYWAAPSLHFETIEYNFEVKQDDAQLVAFKNGQVHISRLPPLKYKSEILDHKELRFADFDPANARAGRSGEFGWEACKRQVFSYVGWNARRLLFADAKTRQAMTYAFPKERIIRDVFMGLGQSIWSDVHPDSLAYDATLKPLDFDLEQAKKLLAEAGWSDSDGDGLLDREQGGKRVPFRFSVKYYANSPEWDNTLAIYRSELKRIGIEMETTPLEWKELIRVYEDRDFDAVVGSWQMSFDLDFYQLWHSSQIDTPGGSNHCAFADPEVDALAVQMREEFDAEKRLAIARKVQQRIHALQPYTFFMSSKTIFIWQNLRPPGSTEADRYLDGVAWGLDHLHPLKSRTPLTWFFPR